MQLKSRKIELSPMDISKDAINRRFVESVIDLTNKIPDLNKKDIAEKLGIKQSTFSEILNGRMGVGVDAIVKFCLIYNYDLYRILVGSEKINNYVSPDSKIIYVSDEDGNKYLNGMENGPNKELAHRILDENKFLREQVILLQEIVKDQKLLIDAFKNGDIIVSTSKDS